VIREGEKKWNEEVKEKQMRSDMAGTFGPEPLGVFHRVARDGDGMAEAWQGCDL